MVDPKSVWEDSGLLDDDDTSDSATARAIAAERLRQLELVNSNVFGTIIAVRAPSPPPVPSRRAGLGRLGQACARRRKRHYSTK